MASHIGETISDGHGTAERDIGDDDPNVTAGGVSAGSGDTSFEVIPPPRRFSPWIDGTAAGGISPGRTNPFITNPIEPW